MLITLTTLSAQAASEEEGPIQIGISKLMAHPALDLIDSKVVRLVKGDYKRKISYDEINPLHKLKEYEEMGARWIHLVDLSGAKDTSKRQLSLFKELIKSCLV